MKSRLLFLGILFTFVLGINDVNAAGNVKLSMSCPGAAKVNSQIVCKVYGSRTGSEIDSVEDIIAKPTGVLKSADYLIDYNLIVEGSQKNIGTVTIQTGNVGTGYIELKFDNIHFVDSSIQDSVKITKKIVVNKTGTVTNNNSVISGGSSNENINSNNNNNNTSTGDTYLKGIKLSRGILSPSFSKNVYKYSVKLPADVNKITIDGVKNDANQVIEGEVVGASLGYGKNVFKLVVSNGNSSKRTYEITITRDDDRDTNTSLSSISLSSGSINFSPDVLEYETKVLYEINKISVFAIPEKETSTVKVTGADSLKVGENIISVTVKSQKGTERKYKIKVNRLKQGEDIGDNANIKNIVISGYNLNFDYNKLTYSLLVKKENSLKISVEMYDPNATYQISGNNDLKDGSVIEISTKSYDGTASKVYTIDITKPKYTIYYVIAISLLVMTIALPALFYFKYVKPKKQLVDINGNRIDKDDLENSKFRRVIDTSIPTMNDQAVMNKTLINQDVQNSVTEPPKYAVNIAEGNLNMETPSVTVASSKCPKCGRELLGTPSICPYCNNKLR